MSHRRFQRHRRQKRGFSRPVSKQWFNMLGVPRDKKRDFFNRMARCVVATCTVTAGVFGLIEMGWLGALLLAGLGTGFGAWFVRQDGMYR